MKNLKKILAVVLAVMMVAALSVTALASGTPADGDMVGDGSKDGVIGAFPSADAPTVNSGIVILYKEIKAFNEDETTINAPTITYTYSIAPGAAGEQVKDAGGASLHTSTNAVEVQTKAGITADATISAAATKTGSTWNYTENSLVLNPSVQLTAASDGAENNFPIKVDFSSVAWTGAGVYRYVITELVSGAADDTASTTAKNAAGIADGTINNVRYLDVYVKDNAAGTGYEVYGFVCFQNLGAIDGTNTSTVTTAAKTEGFVADKSSDGTSDLTADQYYTFNLTVSKTVVNDRAMENNEFPFFVNIKNSTVTAAITLKTKTVEDGATAVAGSDKSGQLSTTSGDPAALTGIADTPTIDHNSNIKYIGIPVGITGATTVSVYETNNVIGTTYASEFSIDGATAADTSKKTISWITTDDANKSVVAGWNQLTMNAANTTVRSVAYTNTLELISPTGVALRIAPYALILAAGMMLLVLSRKSRKAED